MYGNNHSSKDSGLKETTLDKCSHPSASAKGDHAVCCCEERAMFKIGVFVLVLAALVSAAEVPETIKQRNEKYGSELEQYFRDYLVAQYPERAAKAWHRSYTNPQAFLESVEPNRQRYRRMFSPPDLKPVGPLERKAVSIPGVKAEWLSLPLGIIKAEALLVIPDNATKPVPLIIAQHGIDSFPERVFGVARRRESLSRLRPRSGERRFRRARAHQPEFRAQSQPHRAAGAPGGHDPARNRVPPNAAAPRRSPERQAHRQETASACGASASAAWPRCSGCRSSRGSSAGS